MIYITNCYYVRQKLQVILTVGHTLKMQSILYVKVKL